MVGGGFSGGEEGGGSPWGEGSPGRRREGEVSWGGGGVVSLGGGGGLLGRRGGLLGRRWSPGCWRLGGLLDDEEVAGTTLGLERCHEIVVPSDSVRF